MRQLAGELLIRPDVSEQGEVVAWTDERQQRFRAQAAELSARGAAQRERRAVSCRPIG